MKLALTLAIILLPLLSNANNRSRFEYFELSSIVDETSEKAAAVSLRYSYDNKNCSFVKEQVNSLSTWRKLLGDSFAVKKPIISSILSNDEYQCFAKEMQYSMPTEAAKLNNRRALYSGPNCWNTALYFSGLVDTIRFSADSEMTFWMESSYCKKIGPSEKRLPGDIIRVRGYDDAGRETEVHTAIFINHDLIYSKTSSSKDAEYGLRRTQIDYGVYGPHVSECFRGNPEGLCRKWAEYYRCDSKKYKREFKHFLRKNIIVSQIANRAKEIGDKISKSIFEKYGYEELRKESLPKIIKLKAEINKVKMRTKKDKFFIEILKQELNSFYRQFECFNGRICT